MTTNKGVKKMQHPVRVVKQQPQPGVSIWLIIGADNDELARFDSRGGYTERDAEQFAETENNRAAAESIANGDGL
jgi:hypothetical protein